MRGWNQRNPDKTKAIELRKQYGISLEEYRSKLEEQDGLCAICRRPGNVCTGKDSKGSLAVDHNHTTGVIRGLLCHRCNTGLGAFLDKPGLLRIAALYLEMHEARAQAAAFEVSQKQAEVADSVSARLAALLKSDVAG